MMESIHATRARSRASSSASRLANAAPSADFPMAWARRVLTVEEENGEERIDMQLPIGANLVAGAGNVCRLG
jgi:serine protease inhibitor ecotin